MKTITIPQSCGRRALVLIAAMSLSVWAAAQEKKAEDKKPDTPPPAPKSIFPDKALEKAVREQVFAKRNTEDPITAEDVKNISTVRGKGMGIKDLSGLEHCQSLMSIDLSDNQISGLAPLKGLNRLQQIILNNNQIEDLSPIADTIALQYIGIENNKVKSLEPLRKLERLASLYADGNQVTDLTPILKLPKLGSIYLKNNQISKIDGLGGAGRNGQVWSIGLSGNHITDLSPIKGLKPQSFLFLEGNQIADLAPLVEMMKADLAGEKRFAPYVQVYLKGNPFSEAAKKQVDELKAMKVRVRDL
ncbi:MAG: leucine-rich repeat domain-containing protein [Verrucomicrobiae bacterium]|nr:leucine-rich repeat domain-containing protein [Verrucomicrobiae bacterium]